MAIVAAVETWVTSKAGEFPYGPPPPDDVALASGAVRALVNYQLAIEAKRTVPPPNSTLEHIEQARVIAEARFARAIIGSMRRTERPIENRSIASTIDDPQATSATNALAEAQQLHEARETDIEKYAEKEPYGVQHEAALEAALLYTADSADEEWQAREAQEVARSRGYSGVLALLTTTIPDTPATIEEYAGTS